MIEIVIYNFILVHFNIFYNYVIQIQIYGLF